MRRRLFGIVSALAFLFGTVPAHASQTRAFDTLSHMFTQAGNFGPPPYAADPFTCNAQTVRTTYYNTVSNTVKFCNGSVWGSLGGATAGTSNVGGTASTLCWADASNILQCSATVTATGTTSLVLGLGSKTNPAYSFSGSNGLYSPGSSYTSISSSGVNIVSFGSNDFRMQAGMLVGWGPSTPDAAGNDVTIGRIAPGVFGVTSGSWFQNFSGEASLAANFTNATATLSATNLSYTVTSGRHYNFDAYLHLTESTAVDGVQIAFDGGSAAATDFVVDCELTNTGGALAMANSFATALATVINATTTTVTTQSELKCHGMFTPSGAGTFILRAAQNGHTTGTLTILKGSSLILRDTKVL